MKWVRRCSSCDGQAGKGGKEASFQDTAWASTSAREAENDQQTEEGQTEEGKCFPTPDKEKKDKCSNTVSKHDTTHTTKKHK